MKCEKCNDTGMYGVAGFDYPCDCRFTARVVISMRNVIDAFESATDDERAEFVRLLADFQYPMMAKRYSVDGHKNA